MSGDWARTRWGCGNSMPSGLKRFRRAESLHFITFSCFHRRPYLAASETERSLLGRRPIASSCDRSGEIYFCLDSTVATLTQSELGETAVKLLQEAGERPVMIVDGDREGAAIIQG
jgi:hypothetical protein